MLSIAICDDNKPHLDKIETEIKKNLVSQGIDSYRIDTYLSGRELCRQAALLNKYDVVFLDINMPVLNGLEAARILREHKSDILLVFITAYIDYSLEGYKVEATRFLLKDMLEEMLPECIETIIKKWNIQARKRKFPFVERKKELYLEQIYYVESHKHKLIFHVNETDMTQYTLYDKLDHIEAQLYPYGFLRIHKSYLINIAYVSNISSYTLTLKDKITLPIPRAKFQSIKEKYYELKGELL